MKNITLLLLLFSTISAQTLLRQSGNKNMWDIQFLYYASLFDGDHGNAGVAYIPTLREIWTSHWNSNIMHRWTLHQHGTTGVIDSVYPFNIQGLLNVRGMTFDGNSVYAVNNSDTIYKIDPVQKIITGRIITPGSLIRYITHDPTANSGKGGFWVGNFETDAECIDYNGNIIDWLFYNDLGTTNIYGAAFDGFSTGGPYLWVFGQNFGYGFPQEICQVSIETGLATGVIHSVNNDFITYGDSILAGGLFVASGIVPGRITIGGVIQSTGRDLLFGFDAGAGTTIPSTIMLSRSFSFADSKKSSSYRIISLPGNIDIPVSQLMTSAGEHKKDWNVYYDNGKSSDYLVEYSSSAPEFSFRPGRAFWTVSKTPLSISREVSSASSQSGSFSIPLHSGWNLISTPFNSETGWDIIKFANSLGAGEQIHAWEGAWSNPSVMRPYEGYYYYNVGNLTSLIIPEINRVQKSSARHEAKSIVRASFMQDGMEQSSINISFIDGAANGYDESDLFAPPSDFADLSLFICNDEFQTDYKNLFTDTRPAIAGGQEYHLVSINRTGREAELRFNLPEPPPDGAEVFLSDLRLNRLYDLRKERSILVNAVPEKQNYTLLIGSSGFISSKGNNLIPEDYILYQNYPNPFNISTVVRYGVPAKSHVELALYDALGRKAAVLVDQQKEAGMHETAFSGENLSSGLYLLSLRSGSRSLTRKIVLLK